MRDREDQMEVSGGKKFLFVAREPAVRCRGTALGAMTVTAGVVARLLGAAGITTFQMTAKRFSAAHLDRMHHFQMSGRQFMGASVGVAVKPEHVGEFPPGP